MTKNINSIVEKFFTKYPASTLKPGETIIRAGTEIKTIYFLKKGSIRQFINSPEGERLIVQVFKPGSYVPIVPILSDTPCAYTFQSLVPNGLCSMSILRGNADLSAYISGTRYRLN